MPATPARVSYITQEFRKVVSTTQTAFDRFGALARQSDDPIPTFFDSADDAQILADERQALLSPARRRFRVDTVGADEALELAYLGAIPLGHFTDTERAADLTAVVSEIVIDLGRQTASFMVWG